MHSRTHKEKQPQAVLLSMAPLFQTCSPRHLFSRLLFALVVTVFKVCYYNNEYSLVFLVYLCLEQCLAHGKYLLKPHCPSLWAGV